MPLTNEQANQIAALLNKRNKLIGNYDGKGVLDDANNYLCRYSESGDVVACVEVKRVQWYQTEIRHLTVAQNEEGNGHAKALLCEAERLARARNAPLLQCTIRIDNTKSRSLFEGFGFLRTGAFFNERSKNNVDVFQKVLATVK